MARFALASPWRRWLAGGMEPEVALRAARPDDAPLVLEFIRALADYERLSSEVTATVDRIRATLWGEDRAAECLLAFVGEAPAGFAVYFTNYSTFLARPGLYLEDLFVKPEWRGRGVGRALLLHLARQAHARGCGRMEWTVLAWNEPAIGFYRSLGAQVLEDWRVCRLDRGALARLAGDGTESGERGAESREPRA